MQRDAAVDDERLRRLLRHEPVHLLVHQPERHRLVAHQRLYIQNSVADGPARRAHSRLHSTQTHSCASCSTRWGTLSVIKVKDGPYSITERRVPELIPVLGSQPAGDVTHKLGGRLPLLSARPAVTPATLKTAAIPILLLGEQRHNGCKQFAKDCYPTALRLRFEPGPSAPESSTLTTRLPSHPQYDKPDGIVGRTLTIASTVNFVPFDRRRRWSPVYHTEEGISRCTTKVNSIRPSAFTELRHEPVHLLVDQPKRHRFVAHQRLHSTQMNPCNALPHAHSTGHVGERPVTSVTICHTCSRSRGSYISRLLERLPRTSQTTVAFCLFGRWPSAIAVQFQ